MRKKHKMFLMNSSIRGLVLSRIMAHTTYMTPKIEGSKKQKDFVESMNRAYAVLLEDLGEPRFDLNEGSELARQVVGDILNQTQKRFMEYGSRSFYIEKLL